MNHEFKANGMTKIEIVAVVFMFAVLLVLLLPALATNRGPGCRRAACLNNLKQWALVFKMYANESKGEMWPPLQANNPNTGEVDFAVGPYVAVLYPEYLTDPAIAICPQDPDTRINDLKDENDDYNLHLHPGKIDSSYVYLGWAFDKMGPQAPLGQATGTAPISSFPNLGTLLLALKAEVPKGTVPVPYQIGAALDALGAANTKNLATIASDPNGAGLMAQALFDSDINGVNSLGSAWPAPRTEDMIYGNGDSNTVYRLREGIERFMITDTNNPGASAKAQSKLWIMMDKFTATSNSESPSFNHVPAGSNVLYLDGHVEMVKYESISTPSEPVSPSMASMLSILTSL